MDMLEELQGIAMRNMMSFCERRPDGTADWWFHDKAAPSMEFRAHEDKVVLTSLGKDMARVLKGRFTMEGLSVSNPKNDDLLEIAVGSPAEVYKLGKVLDHAFKKQSAGVNL